MKRIALGLAVALSLAGSACALHPVTDPGYDPYDTTGGERAAYEHEQRHAYAQQRAYEHAAARDEYARRRAYEHERREHERFEHERAIRAAHERAAWERHADARDRADRDRAAHVTGYGPAGARVAPAPAPDRAPSRVMVRPAPVQAPEGPRHAPMVRPSQPDDGARERSRSRNVQIHRSVARPE